MPMPKYDVCAIGNALVDIIADADENFLRTHDITKGAMTLIDTARAEHLYGKIGPAIEMSGGSAANTVAGIASLGGHPAYMGKTRADQLGDIFRHDMQATGVHFATAAAKDAAPTGRCIILVTPDAQRSMNTYLGAAVEFGPDDIQPDIIGNSRITYLEGYLFDPPLAKEAFRKAAGIVHETGRQLALTLSDTFCVERHRAEFLDLITSEVDILFANQSELLALYQTGDLQQAVGMAQKHCKIAITTRSEKGAVIAADEGIFEVPAAPVAHVVDTTGAGDLYAAGFLYGLTHGYDLIKCGQIGAIAAAEVIGHYGPRPQQPLKELIHGIAA